MRILLDLQGCQSNSRFRGIGRYSLSLAKAIARNAGEHQVWLLLSGLFPDTIMQLRREFAGLVRSESIAVFSAIGPVAEKAPGNTTRARVAELVREHAIAELDPDVVHVGSLFEGFDEDAVASIGRLDRRTSMAVTLYDLIPLLNSTPYLDNPQYRRYYLGKIASLKRAHLLLAISESTKREAELALDISGRVVNISSAADEHFHPAAPSPQARKAVLSRFGLLRPFILHLGVIEPRKNFEGLIRAYAQLPQQLRATHQLFLVAQGDAAARGDLRRLAASLGLTSQDMIVVDHVSDSDLVSLYSLCRLFVFPSLHEGFGLPALEAMACGAAVIGSNRSSIPEVIGREDFLFDPSSPCALAERMSHALSDEMFYQSLRAHGAQQAKNFSWDATAKRALRAFEALHDRRGQQKPTDRKGSIYRSLISAIAKDGAGLSGVDLVRTAEAVAANLSPGTCRQLLVDISALVHVDARTGIQRVVRSVLLELLRNPPSGYAVCPIFGDERGSFRYARNFTYGFLDERALQTDGECVDDPVDVKRGDVFLGLDLSAHLFPAFTPTLRHFRNLGVQLHFVVYDLIPLLHPEWCAPNMPQSFLTWLSVITELADSLVGISRSVANALSVFVRQQSPKRLDLVRIAHFHLGADIASSVPTVGVPPDANEVISRLSSSPTFLMVGTIEPRKGYVQALAAFEDLWAEGVEVNLVIVGRQGWKMEAFVRQLRMHVEHGRRLHWLEGISDEYFEKLYRASTCLIAASEAEGFGLPLIEAAQHNLPIIARDIPVFREVAGEHAYYFSGTSPGALAEAVRSWMALTADGKAPSSDRMRWLTWRESTEQLLRVILGGTSEVFGSAASRVKSQ
jgi:glycosyltransferase involved in cell wall biosynthesis